MEDKTVVFVDDEELILKSLKRLFKREPFQAFFFNSAREAIDYIKDHEIDLLVTDIRMPDMDGSELLNYVKQHHPSVMRIALSGYTESNMIYDLIEKNIAKLFIFKPWDSHELKEAIRGVLEFEDILKSNNLLELINNIDSLPVLPEIYRKVNRLILNDADIDEIGEVVSQDQAIALKVLKLANSAFYGRKTGDLNEAIMGVGLNNLKSIILSNSIFSGPDKILMELMSIWDHSVRTNQYVHMIYKDILNKKLSSLFGSVGLLHDIGKVMFLLYYHEDYHKMLLEIKDQEESVVMCEKDQFQVSHTEIGAYLLNWWELPHCYIEAALYHHRPSKEGIVNKELIYVLHLASYYSMKFHHPDGSEDYLDPKAFTYLSIDRDELEEKIKALE